MLHVCDDVSLQASRKRDLGYEKKKKRSMLQKKEKIFMGMTKRKRKEKKEIAQSQNKFKKRCHTQRSFISIYPHTCTSWSVCMTCYLLGSGFWLCKICNASMPHHFSLPWAPQSLARSRMKRDKTMPWWGIIHIEWLERIVWGTLSFIFQNLSKSPERKLNKEWVNGALQTVLSLNRSRKGEARSPTGLR